MTVTEPIDVTEVIDVEETEPASEPVAQVPAIVDDPIDQMTAVPDLPVIAPENEFRALAMQAKMLSGSSLVPSALRGKPHDVLLILMTGRDLGIAPTAALRKCYVVDGQVTIAPMLKSALVKMKGAGCIRPAPDNDAEHATAIAYDPDGKEIARHTVTWDDVKDVTINSSGKKLIAKDNWKNYPKRMLYHRASGYLVDDIWPEIGLGIYSPDEIGAITDEEGHVIDVKEVRVVDGFERKEDAPPEMISDDVAQALTDRARALPAEAVAALKAQFLEREIRGSFFSQTAAKAKVLEPMIVAMEKRAASGEWGDWSPVSGAVVDGDGVVSAPEPVADVADRPDDTAGPTAADVDDSWDAARLATLELSELVKVDRGILVDACHEWGVEIDDEMTVLTLAGLFDAEATKGF